MAIEISVRTGTPADMPAIMAMCHLLAAEIGIVALDERKIVGEFWPALHLDGGIVGVVGSEGGAPEGFVLLKMTTQWYSSEISLEERGAFVREEFRAVKGGRARKLCEFAKSTAEKLGLPLLIGILSNQRTEAKVKLYTRCFGPPSGAFFLVNGKTGDADRAARDDIMQGHS